MTAPSRDDAVQAVAEALAVAEDAQVPAYVKDGGNYLAIPGDWYMPHADAALDALGPYIAGLIAADREATARAIEAAFTDWDALGPTRSPHPVGSPSWTVERAYADAARIVRERAT